MARGPELAAPPSARAASPGGMRAAPLPLLCLATVGLAERRAHADAPASTLRRITAPLDDQLGEGTSPAGRLLWSLGNWNPSSGPPRPGAALYSTRV